MNEGDRERLLRINERVGAIERLALELKQLGQGVPAVEKNAESILSTVYVLKFGISDIAGIDTP
jgi:hypothetical protein